MKKFLKTTTALAFATLVATSSLGVSATKEVQKIDSSMKMDLSCQYLMSPNNRMKIFYDYGTSNWYDDAYATTEVKIHQGESVTAKTYIKFDKNNYITKKNNQKDFEGIVHSGNACLSGIDYAKYVQHDGYVKDIRGDLSNIVNRYTYRISDK